MKEESLGIVIAEITSVEKVPETKSLYRVTLKGNNHNYQIATSLASFYQKSDLVGKQVPIKVDVEATILFGVKSDARFIAILSDNEPVLLVPETSVENGALVI